MSAPQEPPDDGPVDEAELFAQLANVRVEQLVAEAASSLVTVGFVRTGLVPEAPDALDLAQARVAIDARLRAACARSRARSHRRRCTS